MNISSYFEHIYNHCFFTFFYNSTQSPATPAGAPLKVLTTTATSVEAANDDLKLSPPVRGATTFGQNQSPFSQLSDQHWWMINAKNLENSILQNLPHSRAHATVSKVDAQNVGQATLPYHQDLTCSQNDVPWSPIHPIPAGAIRGISHLILVDSYPKWPKLSPINSATTGTVITGLRQDFPHGFNIVQSHFPPNLNGRDEQIIDNAKRRLLVSQEEETVEEILHSLLRSWYPNLGALSQTSTFSVQHNHRPDHYFGRFGRPRKGFKADLRLKCGGAGFSLAQPPSAPSAQQSAQVDDKCKEPEEIGITKLFSPSVGTVSNLVALKAGETKETTFINIQGGLPQLVPSSAASVRYFSKQGVPKVIVSRNASSSLLRYLRTFFVVSMSPIFHGLNKQFVGVVKRQLLASQGEDTVQWTTLYTALSGCYSLEVL
ncbi:hypothetical protein ACTXT7_011919 [Hymenolepis weldensis]